MTEIAIVVSGNSPAIRSPQWNNTVDRRTSYIHGYAVQQLLDGVSLDLAITDPTYHV